MTRHSKIDADLQQMVGLAAGDLEVDDLPGASRVLRHASMTDEPCSCAVED